MTRRERRAARVSALIGGAVTVLVVAAYLLGRLDGLERDALDSRFRFANPIVPSDQIAIIGIDDRSLTKIGRWPWPRDQQAPLVSIPAEFGARRILVDLTWLEHEDERAAASEFADLMTGSADTAWTSDARTIDPDRVLAGAISGAGNVYLAYHHLDLDLVHSAAFQQLVDLIQAGDDQAARQLASRIGKDLDRRLTSAEDRQRLRPFDLARITAALRDDPLLDEDEIHELTGLSASYVSWGFSQCHDTAVRELLRRWLEASPERWDSAPATIMDQFHTELTGRPLELRTPLGRVIGRACRHLLSYRPTTSRPLGTPEALGAIAQTVDSIEPVHFRLAGAARRCCYANFAPDRDGVVRWLTLLEQHRDNILSQLGFSVGWDDLELTPQLVGIEQKRLVARPPGVAQPLVMKLDGQGRTLIPWARGSDWREQYDVYPATFVIRLHDLRANHRDNVEIERQLFALIYSAEALPAFNHLAELIASRREIEPLLAGQDAEMTSFFQQQLAQIDSQLAEGERDLRALIDRARAAQGAGDGAAVPLEPRLVEDVAYYLAEIERARDANLAIDRDIARHATNLHKAFDGRICLIGYTATSLADFKPIPTAPRGAPGVLAHANILNGMITNQMVYWLPGWFTVLTTAILGIAASVISAMRKPRDAVVWVVFLAVLYTVVVYGAFYTLRTWVHLAAPLAALLLSYVSIAVYRYIFIDGERRQLATALGQYTSKEIARQMAEDPELCQRAEEREVTSVFTDLRGFTTISERIGAERTQKVLNTCLGCFTDVMIRHEGMVNKFMGDGIFAFWNPVIYPQPDHARRACEAGIDLLVALEDLKAQKRADGGDDAYQELFLRVGVATGWAIVGPCGSEQKYDYTCIGDSVNLAARLESANKFYGTELLVGGPAREQAGADLEFRSLGGVRVKGKTEAVPIFELLGRKGEVPSDKIEYAERFGRSVAQFQHRVWDAAEAAFEDCLRSNPDDLAAQRYREACGVFREAPPPDDWNGAIELTEK